MAVPRETILTDELVQRLIETGQVDLLVGVPSFQHEATIGPVVRQVHVAFARHFPRERTLVLAVDGGSTDGTVDAVRSATPDDTERIVTSQALRTMHRIAVPYHGVQGKDAALRTILTAGDLLQARAVVIADPGMRSFSAEWVHRLAGPVLRGEADFTTPLYARHPLEGPLVTQLVRPLVRALYGWQLAEPLAGEFGASRKLVTHLIAQPIWGEHDAAEGIDLRVALEAVAADFTRLAVAVGPHRPDPSRPRPPLAQAFAQIGQSLLAGFEAHFEICRGREGSRAIRISGDPIGAADPPAALDPTPLAEAFCRGVRDLDPVLAEALPAPLLDELRAVAAAGGVPELGDELWARTLFGFLDADRRRALARPHIAQAVVPFYLGRTAWQLHRDAARSPSEIEACAEALALEFERLKHESFLRWPSDARR